MAYKEALSLASDLHARKIHVETDCMATVKHVVESYRGPSRMVISKIKTKMKEFDEVNTDHEKRESTGRS